MLCIKNQIILTATVALNITRRLSITQNQTLLKKIILINVIATGTSVRKYISNMDNYEYSRLLLVQIKIYIQ